MKVHILIRRIAGAYVLANLLPAHHQSPFWLWLTAVAGFILLHDSRTNICPSAFIPTESGAHDVGGKTAGPGAFSSAK